MIMDRWCNRRMDMRGIISARTIIRERRIKNRKKGR
jgi:hypothetical protein